jgi:hypothetical protein
MAVPDRSKPCGSISAAVQGALHPDDVNDVTVLKGRPGETGWPFDVSGRKGFLSARPYATPQLQVNHS